MDALDAMDVVTTAALAGAGLENARGKTRKDETGWKNEKARYLRHVGNEIERQAMQYPDIKADEDKDKAQLREAEGDDDNTGAEQFDIATQSGGSPEKSSPGKDEQMQIQVHDVHGGDLGMRSGQKRRTEGEGNHGDSSLSTWQRLEDGRWRRREEAINMDEDEILREIEEIERDPVPIPQVDKHTALDSIDVAEFYSPARVVAAAKSAGLNVSDDFIMDSTTVDENGDRWDFDLKRMRTKAMRKVRDEKPGVVIGSAMCTGWSIIMNANWGNMSPVEIARRMKRARMHLNFICQLCLMQHAGGRYVVHEYPAEARSWKERCVQHGLARTGAKFLAVDQCRYGLKYKNQDGIELPARKRTTFMTQCPAMQVTLNKPCHHDHQPMPIEGGNMSKAMRIYPQDCARSLLKQ